MGKKSRFKKYRRVFQDKQAKAEQGTANREAGLMEAEPSQEKGLAWFLLGGVKIGVFLALFAPLIVSRDYYFPFVGPKSLYFMGLAQVVIFCWLGLMLLTGRYRPKLNWLSAALVVFFIVLSLSALFGVNLSYSFWSKFERMTGILMWLHLLGFFLALTAVFQKEKDWQNIFSLSLVCALMIGSLSFLSKAVSFKYISLTQVGGLSLHNNSFFAGAYFLLCLAFSGWLFWKKRWRELALFAGLALGFILLLSSMGTGGSTRGGATIGNSSFMGTYLMFNVFFGVYLFWRYFKKSWLAKHWPKIIFSLVFLLAGLLIFWPIKMESARAATYGVLAGLLWLGVLYLALAVKNKGIIWLGRAALALGLVFAVLMGILFFTLPFNQETKLVDYFPDQLTRFVVKATQNRGVVWLKAWQGFKERPLLGWGPENFEFVFTKYFNPCMFLSDCGGEIWFDRAHNIVFDTLAALGAIGFLSYLAVFFSALFILWKAYLKEKKITFIACALPTVILTVYFVQNLTVFDMVSSYLMFIIVLGFISAAAGADFPFQFKRFSSAKESPRKKRLWPLALLGLLFLASFFEAVLQPARAGQYVIEALRAETPEARLDYYQKVFQASPLGIFQSREFLAQNSDQSVQKIIDNYRDKITNQVVELIREEFDIMIVELNKTKKEASLDFRSALRLAQLYNTYAFLDISKAALAEETAREVIKLSPTNQQGYWSLAQSLVNQQKYQEALEQAKKAIDLEPRWLQSYQIAVQVAGYAGEVQRQKELVSQAIQANPGWSTSSFQGLLVNP